MQREDKIEECEEQTRRNSQAAAHPTSCRGRSSLRPLRRRRNSGVVGLPREKNQAAPQFAKNRQFLIATELLEIAATYSQHTTKLFLIATKTATFRAPGYYVRIFPPAPISSRIQTNTPIQSLGNTLPIPCVLQTKPN
jgi:hypothetical protein